MEVTIDGVRYVPAPQDQVVLTILVPSTSSRRSTFAPRIAASLFGQHERLPLVDQLRVEILMLADTGRSGGMLVGDKRNAMVRMARGKYVVFVDDDDRVEPDYIAELLRCTEGDPDVIVFHAMVSINGASPRACEYDIRFERDENLPGGYQRLPNHLMAVRRVLALACPFPSKQKGEDSDYAMRLKPSLKRQNRVGKALYHYDYSDATTETQGIGVAATSVDVVILSKASNEVLHTMCQTAIDTCKAGAGQNAVNIIVIEQADVLKYEGATTIRDASEFNYNKFANAGAARGTAPWIMVANSDLVFEKGWLDALLAANRECVSPVDPLLPRHTTIRHDSAGWDNGLHFSGWCFMVSRSLWERIGRFDDCVTYWCSDDVVIEQCRQKGVMPMVVSAARVRHLGSKTLARPPDDHTWAQVVIFNTKYKKKKFHNDNRFIAYCKFKGISL